MVVEELLAPVPIWVSTIRKVSQVRVTSRRVVGSMVLRKAVGSGVRALVLTGLVDSVLTPVKKIRRPVTKM